MPIAKEGKNKNFGYKCHKMPGTAKLVWLHNFMASTFIYMPKSTLSLTQRPLTPVEVEKV